MTFDCTHLKSLIQSFSLVKECDLLKDGTLRISTPFLYPDGSNIDLFVEHEANLMANEPERPFRGLVLSDGAQTALWLLNLNLPLWGTKKRIALVEKISGSVGVKFSNGKLLVAFENHDLSEFSSAMVRVAQACVRVAGLLYLQRFPVGTHFKDDVEEFIERSERPYELDVSLPARFGHEVSVDFRVRGTRVTSLLRTVTAKTTSSAHSAMNETFVC